MERFCFSSKALILGGMSLILSCGFVNESAQSLSSRAPRVLAAPPIITSLDISNNTLTLQGNALTTVTSIQLTGPGVNTTFTNSSVSETSLSALALAATNITVGALYSLAISNAYGASTFPITFTLPSPLSISGSNVGIGTATPGFPLDVKGTGTTGATTSLNLQDSAGVSTFSVDNGGGVRLKKNSLISGDGDVTIDIDNDNNDLARVIAFTHNNGTELMRIQENGNVGIGTTSLGTELLTVVSNAAADVIKVQNANVAGSSSAIFYDNGGTFRGQIGYSNPSAFAGYAGKMILASGTGTDILISTDDNFAGTVSERIRIQSTTGNVGIGNTNPNGPLVITKDGHQVLGSTFYAVATTDNTAFSKGLNLGYSSSHYGGAIMADPDGTHQSELSFWTVTVAQSAVERMRIDSLGNVGIGLPNPTYQLQLSTDSAAKPGTNTWTIASDERLKNIRAPFTRGLAAINQIHPIYFRYKDGNALNLPTNTEYVGIIAQEAEKAVPEAVSKDDKGFLHMNTDAIFWAMVNSIKELYAKLMDHDQQISILKADIETKDREIQSLKQENLAIKERLDKIEGTINSK